MHLKGRVEHDDRFADPSGSAPSNTITQTTQVAGRPAASTSPTSTHPASSTTTTTVTTESSMATESIQGNLPKSTGRARKPLEDPPEGVNKRRRQPLAQIQGPTEINRQPPKRPRLSASRRKTSRRRQAESAKSMNGTAGHTPTDPRRTSVPTGKVNASSSLSGGSQRHLRFAGCDIAGVSNELRTKEGKRIIKASQKLIDGKGE